MDILELEKYRTKIIEIKNQDYSSRRLLFILNEYLSTILSFNNAQMLTAYFDEYIDQYLQLLAELDPIGLMPKEMDNLIATAEKLKSTYVFKNYRTELNSCAEKLRSKISDIKLKLEGGAQKLIIKSEILFPVLEKTPQSNTEYGFLERLSIYLRKNIGSEQDNFIVVPSVGKIDVQLKNQIRLSWNYAMDFIKKSSRNKIQSHEVVIQFDKRYGIYEGESLGIALTIGFIQELIKFYNLRELVRIKGNIVTTGGINSNGKVNPVSKEIIQKKVKTVFYSTADIFVIADEDKVFADAAFNELKELYPLRKLEIIPVTKISDIFNRRDLVELKKQSLLFWSSKKIIQNKAALFLLILLVTALTVLIFISTDSNPSIVDSYNHEYHIKNKYGKILWSISTIEDYTLLDNNKNKMIKRHTRIIDVDNDGTNEVLIARASKEHIYKLLLYDDRGNVLNEFNFNYEVQTSYEKFTNRYSIYFIEEIIFTKNGPIALLIANHESYYPSFILRLNLSTFQLEGKPFVHSGHLTGITVNDIDNDGRLELLCNAVSNGYRGAVFFVIELDKLYGTSPAIEDYKILDFPIAEFEHYFLLPKSDYCELVYPKYNTSLWAPHLLYENKVISVGVIESHPKDYYGNHFSYSLRFSTDFNETQLVIGDAAAIERDRLVKSGRLQYPLTDTKEFRNTLLKQIQRWNGKEFVQMFPEKEEVIERNISIENKKQH
ncbi:MAG: hypothetical protein HND52_16365 [Ignavibacteriae bacterium]|nr:hypothetical protein [Ignavibacteriota bacterium]NOG99532.1 hypothetical protein [Ignavibacteriota bacterium]